MRRSLLLLLPALLAAASCGTSSQYASTQMYPDGIYYRPEPVVELYSEEDFKEMAAQNLASKNAGRDSLTVSGTESDWYADDYYRYNYWYSPYYSSYYGRYYSPFYSHYWGPSWYCGWYSSLYDPWYDPYWGPSYWGPSYWGPSYWGGSYYYGYRPHHIVPPAGSHHGNNTENYATGVNHRRSGSMSSGSGKSDSNVSEGRTQKYQRSGRSTSYSSGSDSGYSSSSSSSHSSYSGSSHSGSSYSGSSHSGGGYSGSSSHSGGSGGGRR